MINPDGVCKGHYRKNVLNQNLNRFYLQPDPVKQPEVYGIKKLMEYYGERIKFYMDFHAHSGNKGHFVYGNACDDILEQIEANLYSKIVGLNCPNFEYEYCCFSKKQMKTRDKYEDMTKEGAGRVVAYTQFKIIQSYTFELGFHQANYVQNLQLIQNQNLKVSNYQCTQENIEESAKNEPYFFTPECFYICGKALVCSILDYYDKNPYSRIQSTEYKDIKGLRKD
ncbi:hypothetical protein PPERSA_11555 [Pseudocohnilembus persalinus]|uniref:Peptidase M14 domain-containing protein n=1 Tax=Pseudocohnilembus persalinus TaxID=266149 RepID=A0A0V0Q7J1_PSEPJ|nr:hypothetical protein PPERSA_11555 [Pseudocohnilembus persalinus]|eukprot:KRW98122.1 hypothetical protein PPERSA_11555 [Pseudocohnilembus persalinus]